MRINIKNLKIKHTQKSGRNSYGRVTIRHCGGGCSKKDLLVDYRRQLVNQEGIVIGFDLGSEGNRNCPLAFIYIKGLGIFVSILAAESLKLWDIIFFNLGATKGLTVLSIGSSYQIKALKVNTKIFNVESHLKRGGQLARSSGTFALLIKHKKINEAQTLSQIRLPSGKSYYVDGNCVATLGSAANSKFKFQNLKKAGDARHLGLRPRVRGVAMNPVDHPHGGGEGKTSGGRISVSAWGRLTKGLKTLEPSKKKNLKLFEKRYNKGLTK